MTDLPVDYSLLSPDFMLDAIESIGIRVDSGLLELNSYENRVFQFLDEDRKRFVVKFYRPVRWSDEQIQEEHDFSLQLKSADIDVVAPLQFDGCSLFIYQGYRFAIFPSAGGRPIEVDNLDALESVGRNLGRVHQLASKQPFLYRPTLSIAEFVQTPKLILQQSNFVPKQLETSFFDVYDTLEKEITLQYKPDDNQLIRLHGDLHAGNILWRDKVTLLDFDDCRQGPAVQDIWMMLHGERHEQLLQLEVMLEGYEEFCSFDPKQLKLIEPLRAMRMMNYMGWIAKRWGDPAFSRHFSWFTDEDYWQQQVRFLHEQIDNMQKPPLSLIPNY
ncbi:YihE protein, a ser/thr kinase implicated in LPS synthesis and Cpx signaling [Moritella sp. JT01]|uniref:serine/threonine protein kinase n=1 Tax=Moritella sp. JT01 TaxID=756698 RepID=UPI0007952777|nr:serine/threonine protein kinase [Moritella sp. JT01]KXO06810.1 YihE protein, a ser/thr kinase implicated in LPS synthesis and Cpx signaling [Moritella sp. JT01]